MVTRLGEGKLNSHLLNIAKNWPWIASCSWQKGLGKCAPSHVHVSEPELFLLLFGHKLSKTQNLLGPNIPDWRLHIRHQILLGDHLFREILFSTIVTTKLKTNRLFDWTMISPIGPRSRLSLVIWIADKFTTKDFFNRKRLFLPEFIDRNLVAFVPSWKKVCENIYSFVMYT